MNLSLSLSRLAMLSPGLFLAAAGQAQVPASGVAELSAASERTSQTTSPPTSPPTPPKPLWELGGVLIGVSQQAYPGADQNVQRSLALPFFVYRGEVIRADGETAGLRALRTPLWELDIGVSGSFGSSSNDIRARQGMPNLGTLIEFGPKVNVNLGQAMGGRWRVELPVRGVFDLGDGLARRGLALEPELNFSRRLASGRDFALGVSAIVGDQRLVDTFYAVDPRFAQPGRAAYAAQAGLVAWRFTASGSIPLTRDWQLFGFTRIDTVAGAANRSSPLVRATTGASMGLGLSYTWQRSDALAKD